MRIGLQDTDWKHIGAKLANCDDDEQAAFFKAFLKECLSWGTSLQVEQQLACVNSKLDVKEREALAMLSYIEEEG